MEKLHKIFLFFIVLFYCSIVAFCQPERWQQKIKYLMDVDMDVEKNKLSGTSKIDYWNNSPDTLQRIFVHLYWNAFQPGSCMDERSRQLGKTVISTDAKGNQKLDWDARVKDRISKLLPEQIGYQKLTDIKINGLSSSSIEHETILEIIPAKPLLPRSKNTIEFSFNAQVPIQIRRTGRDNAEGIRYSMSQWYPKIVEYDYQGWNANPYIAREFYGVWGDYEVKINIDKNYLVAGTGVLQEPEKIGFGYAPRLERGVPTSKPKRSWTFKGENIHDFVWAADTAYKHISKTVGGTVLHVFYKKGTAFNDSLWNNVLWSAEKVLPFIESNFGKYPYPQYSFIQGGDGGMEYAMATLLRGPGLGGVFHEWMHNWYQHLLGTNESLFPWMDEGFTTYATEMVEDYYYKQHYSSSPFINKKMKEDELKNFAKEAAKLPSIHSDSYDSYLYLAASPFEEPLSTHADHFNTNFAYTLASYSKGSVFLGQLGYIIGEETLSKVLIEYYNVWKYKHPNANDFIRIAEKISGQSLQWYKEYWVNSTKTIDYAIGNIIPSVEGTGCNIVLKRVGKMPMPIDVLVTFKDGTSEWHTIPLNLQYGNKKIEKNVSFNIATPWKWTHPEYSLPIKKQLKDIKSVEIDPTFRLADTKRENNKLIIPE